MSDKRMLPIGIEDFSKLIKEGFYYADKTGFIRELLMSPCEAVLFTRPRRFGKSLNMSMLRHFFEIGTDPSLFNGLEISKEWTLCQKYLGKFPVISVSLKGVAGGNYEHAVSSLKETLQMELRRHQYLLDSDRLSDIDKEQLRRLFSDSIDEYTLEHGLLILSELLFKHHTQKVIILIDEYDVPLAKAYDYGYYDKFIVLIRNLLHQTLKSNENLQLAVLSGCMRIAKESIFTGLNNLKTYGITNTLCDEYFGFSDSEVQDLLSYYDLLHQYPIVKSWYNGYQFGNHSIYCPWDVINYVFDQRHSPGLAPQNYWINTSSNDIIYRFLNKANTTTRYEIEQLIEGKTIDKEIYPELTYNELDKTINHLWSVLFTTGYLSYENTSMNLSRNTLRLKIPNEEIRSIFKEQILSWFNDHVETDTERYTRFCQAFADGDAVLIQEMFNAYLREMISIRDTSIRQSMKENFYHGILLGILHFRNDWLLFSNREGGEGYNDIMIVLDEKRIGILIEVKYAENDNLDSECKKAFDQMEKLHYSDAFLEYRPEKVFKYAIACYKKHCKVEMKIE